MNRVSSALEGKGYGVTTTTLDEVRAAAAGCQACDLWRKGTQTVFGEGPEHAELMLVGEQPGDREDVAGRPFVGPAGRLLDRALEQAGIGRDGVYLTNAVKHFKWRPQGKRRIHQRPDAVEIGACRQWLDAEIDLVSPRVIMALGATAAGVILGSGFKVTRDRGRFVDGAGGCLLTATVHPSSILRVTDGGDREAAMDALVQDLASVAKRLAA